MDATTGSNGHGFDAALRALEDLETSVAQTRDEPAAAPAAAVAPAAEPVLPVVSALAFSDGEEGEPVAIAAIPVSEIETGQPVPPLPIPPETPHAGAAPAAVATEPAPGVPRKSAGRWTKIAIGLGLASSVVSAAGLVIAERTIASAQLVVATARERQEQLEHATKLIHDLEIVRDKQIELLKAQQAQLASAPVTSAELQHRMEVLQEGILKREPVTQVVEVIRSGQSDTNARLNEFGMKLDRLSAAAGR